MWTPYFHRNVLYIICINVILVGNVSYGYMLSYLENSLIQKESFLLTLYRTLPSSGPGHGGDSEAARLELCQYCRGSGGQNKNPAVVTNKGIYTKESHGSLNIPTITQLVESISCDVARKSAPSEKHTFTHLGSTEITSHDIS